MTEIQLREWIRSPAYRGPLGLDLGSGREVHIYAPPPLPYDEIDVPVAIHIIRRRSAAHQVRHCAEWVAAPSETFRPPVSFSVGFEVP